MNNNKLHLTAVLPKSFQPTASKDLIRLGGSRDGGYLVSENDIDHSDYLLSFGLSDNWDFESHFVARNNVRVDAYDASSGEQVFRKKAVSKLLELSLYPAVHYALKSIEFKNFFQGEIHHVAKFVGSDDSPDFVSMDDVFAQCPSDKTFIKMDIEGSEYDCLESILTHQNRLTGAAVEFHDVDNRLDEISSFISRFDLSVTHVHVNNFGHITSDGTPSVIEMTFSRFAETTDAEPSFPHELDAPNKKSRPDVSIRFA